ncbi:MAG: alpha amylase C-terminal domain-containing protein, partial [Myxococcota bacterium]
GDDQIAFSRGDRGFVAINNSEQPMSATLPTGMAPGSYCDIASGDFDGKSCTGQTVIVADDGTLAVAVGARDALAIHADARLP